MNGGAHKERESKTVRWGKELFVVHFHAASRFMKAKYSSHVIAH